MPKLPSKCVYVYIYIFFVNVSNIDNLLIIDLEGTKTKVRFWWKNQNQVISNWFINLVQLILTPHDLMLNLVSCNENKDNVETAFWWHLKSSMSQPSEVWIYACLRCHTNPKYMVVYIWWLLDDTLSCKWWQLVIFITNKFNVIKTIFLIKRLEI